MEESASCPNCHNQLAPGTPPGRCPHCLLMAAAQSDAPIRGAGARFAPPAAEYLNERLAEFEVLSLIGRGGMGAVYKAIHLRLDRVVAIKVLPPELAESDPAFGERFLREARSVAKLQHPNLVVVHDFGEADGLFFIVMEYVEGPTLRKLIQSGELSPERSLEIVPQICAGLLFMHQQGLIHRDIKPENILIGDDGRVRITDFGLARLVDPAQADISLTGTSHAPGTPHYMAPEQLRDPGRVDHRADIFALGVVFYEMLTGHLPQGRFPMPSESSSVAKGVDEVVMRSLEPDPEQRYQQANEVHEALEKSAEDSAKNQGAPEGAKSAVDEKSKRRKKKPDLKAGPLFTDKPLSKDDLRTDSREIRTRSIRHGIFISCATLLPWGGMETFSGGGVAPALVFGGMVNVFGIIYVPIFHVLVVGIVIACIAGFEFIRYLPKRWNTLQRICRWGFWFCVYSFFYFFIVWVDQPTSHNASFVAASPDGSQSAIGYPTGESMPAPGFGAIVTALMFAYARRYFKRMHGLSIRYAEYERRERKRRQQS